MIRSGFPNRSQRRAATAVHGTGALKYRRSITPPIITGALSVGDLLTCSSGTWLSGPYTYTYQWFRNSIVIVGGTNPTQSTVGFAIGDSISVTQTPVNSSGEELVGASSTAVVLTA